MLIVNVKIFLKVVCVIFSNLVAANNVCKGERMPICLCVFVCVCVRARV